MNQTTAPFDHVLSDDKSVATITLPSNSVMLTAQEIENAIHWLGALRSGMSPPVPMNIADQKTVLTVDFCDFNRLDENLIPATGGATIGFRSHLLGWFSFAASPEFLRGLPDWISGVDNTPPKNTTLN